MNVTSTEFTWLVNDALYWPARGKSSWDKNNLLQMYTLCTCINHVALNMLSATLSMQVHNVIEGM